MIRLPPAWAALWLAVAAVLVGGVCSLSAEGEGDVVLRPGQDLQAIVARSPEGTRFVLEPGIYRRQTIIPKDGQKFIGQAGVVLNGALELTVWTRVDGLWRSAPLPAALPFHGECAAGRELCSRREDLFVDDRLYQPVGTRAELGSGRWHRKDGAAWLADDPRGQSVELGVTPRAFGGAAENVVLKQLVVEKYATDAQQGAIFADNGRGWHILDVTARWNHGLGLSFGPGTTVKGGSYSHNGQLGLAASSGAGSRVQRVEIAYNNYAGYDPAWEGGGTKFWETDGLIVKNSCIHHNGGPGLWTDNDNINTIYEDNKVFRNANEGIKHEISYDAIIRNNVVVANGSGFDEWLWGSQILIQDSSNVEVHDNLVETSGNFGNGIGVVYQERGTGAFGPWQAANNRVHHNRIIHRGRRGQNGVATSEPNARFWRESDNRFDRNTYVVADRTFDHWTLNDQDAAWDGIRALGQEANGELVVEQAAPTELSCEP